MIHNTDKSNNVHTSTCKNEVVAQTRCYMADPTLTVEIHHTDAAGDHSVLYMTTIQGLNAEKFFAWMYKKDDDRRMTVQENFLNAVAAKLRLLYRIISNWEIELSNIMITDEGEIRIVDFKNVRVWPEADVEAAVDTAIITLVGQYFNLEDTYENYVEDEEYEHLEEMIQSFMVAKESPDIRFRGETMDDTRFSPNHLQDFEEDEEVDDEEDTEHHDEEIVERHDDTALNSAFDDVPPPPPPSELTINIPSLSIQDPDAIDRSLEVSIPRIAESTTPVNEEEVEQTFVREVVGGKPKFRFTA